MLCKPTSVSETTIEEICQPGIGKGTCRFLIFDGEFCCSKGSNFQSQIELRFEEGTMVACGDNCSGPPDFKTTEKKDLTIS